MAIITGIFNDPLGMPLPDVVIQMTARNHVSKHYRYKRGRGDGDGWKLCHVGDAGRLCGQRYNKQCPGLPGYYIGVRRQPRRHA